MNDFIQFNLLNDTRFGLPKVYVNLFFFHPFMRPNITKDFDNDNYFFSIITYLSFINREINLNLTDAIRAGNTFNVYYSESFFFIPYLSTKIFSSILLSFSINFNARLYNFVDYS